MLDSTQVQEGTSSLVISGAEDWNAFSDSDSEYENSPARLRKSSAYGVLLPE